MPQPTVTSKKGRVLPTSPAGVVVYIVNKAEEILMLSHPQRNGWEPINGGLDAEETVLDACLREAKEEAGPHIQIRPLGACHIETFHYDETVQYMLSLNYVAAYESGQVVPGDDMINSTYRWWSLDALREEKPRILVPGPHHLWLFERAVELYRLWHTQNPPLQAKLHFTNWREHF